ncbi:hypothetical protein FRB91_005996 [Serendipita sp. 411]|nr:hypothetical protein FRB91_005996 [Serendipita sp. 411]
MTVYQFTTQIGDSYNIFHSLTQLQSDEQPPSPVQHNQSPAASSHNADSVLSWYPAFSNLPMDQYGADSLLPVGTGIIPRFPPYSLEDAIPAVFFPSQVSSEVLDTGSGPSVPSPLPSPPSQFVQPQECPYPFPLSMPSTPTAHTIDFTSTIVNSAQANNTTPVGLDIEDAMRQLRLAVSRGQDPLQCSPADKLLRRKPLPPMPSGQGSRHGCEFWICLVPDCRKKQIKRKVNAIHHLYSHAGIKPYKCSHCKSSFRRSHDLKRHMSGKHTVSSTEVTRVIPWESSYVQRDVRRSPWGASSSTALTPPTLVRRIEPVPNGTKNQINGRSVGLYSQRSFYGPYAMLKFIVTRNGQKYPNSTAATQPRRLISLIYVTVFVAIVNDNVFSFDLFVPPPFNGARKTCSWTLP